MINNISIVSNQHLDNLYNSILDYKNLNPKSLTGNSKILLDYKNSLPPLTNNQKEVLIGLVLGDANINSKNLGKTCKVRFEWGKSSKDYSFHIFSLFKYYILSEPTLYTRVNQAGNINQSYRFETLTHSNFLFLWQLFINSNLEKNVPQGTIAKFVTPLSLAYWFLDDGGKMDYTVNKGKGIVLNTQGFSFEQVEFLSQELNHKFHLNSWVGKNKNKPVIKISGKNFELFKELTSPYIIPSMLYKLPEPRIK